MKLNLSAILFLTCFYASKLSAQVNIQDSLALINLYDSTNGGKWLSKNNWKTNLPVNTWFGVTVTNNRVTKLNLGFHIDTVIIVGNVGYIYYKIGDSLSGKIPESLGNLSALTSLDLSYNHLSGSLPTSLSNLKNLQNLSLNNNALVGGLPSEFGGLSGLQSLNFSYNNLNGPIPTAYNNLDTLKYLNLSHNQLSGNIPTLINTNGTHGFLSQLDLSYNIFTGSIPAWSSFNYLSTVLLNNNFLTGNIPQSLGKIPSLNVINFSNNQLTGEVPSTFGELTNLWSLKLSNNKLTGGFSSVFLSLSIPHGIRNDSMTILEIDSNSYTFFGTEQLFTSYNPSSINQVKYSPQSKIHVSNQSGRLFVAPGGLLKNDTIRWYSIGQGLVSTIVGDSDFISNNAGSYTAVVTNKVVLNLTLYSDTAIVLTLPVSLVNFTTVLEKNDVLLKWETLTEENTNFFEIERSTDGVNYTKISRLAASGNSILRKYYNYADYTVSLTQPINYYYRLKEVDKNGQITFSKVLIVKVPGSSSVVSFFPNPAKNQLHVILNDNNKSIVTIYNTEGRKVRKIIGNGEKSIQIDITNLPGGVYVITIDINGNHYKDKFIKG